VGMLRVVIDGPRDPQLNMAIDEAIARYRRNVDYDTLRLYMWLPSGVSIGRRQSVQDTVNIEEINRLGFKLVRRPTGGAALLHPQDYEITYSLVIDSSHELYKLDVAQSAAKIAEGIVYSMKKLGLNAGVRGLGEPGTSMYCYVNPGSSDVILAGKKISGSAQRREWSSLLQHGTLLLSYNHNLFTRVIKVSEHEEVEAKLKVAGLWDIVGIIRIGELYNSLVEGFIEALGYRDSFTSSLTIEELSLALRLYSSKYSRDEWNIRGAHIDL